VFCIGPLQKKIVMAAASEGYRIPLIVARGAPLAKAGLAAGIGKAVLLGVPAALIGVGLGYALLKAFDVRWDEFSTRAADGGPMKMLPPRETPE
jgi:hypothetical protein